MTTTTPAAAHRATMATLTEATTTEQFAAALAGFTHLDQPGFAYDLPDGRYFDGGFFCTVVGGERAMTQVHSLPVHTYDLWMKLHEEQLVQREVDGLLSDLEDERRGPGQPPIGKPVPVRLPEWLITKLDADAKAAGISRARLIRDLIGEAYAARRAHAAGDSRR